MVINPIDLNSFGVRESADKSFEAEKLLTKNPKMNSSSSGRVMVRAELSRKFDLNAALKKGDASKRAASWTWKAVLVSPTSKVTVAISAHLKGVSSLSKGDLERIHTLVSLGLRLPSCRIRVVV